jgi:trk system potassium uptake protein TrkA
VDIPEHVKLLHKVNIDITVSPSELSALKMIRFIRNCNMGDSDNGIGKFYNIAGNKAEVMEFVASSGFRALNKPIKDIKLKKDVLITSIIRGDELIIPSGNTCISEGDRVIIASSKQNKIRNLPEILPR